MQRNSKEAEQVKGREIIGVREMIEARLSRTLQTLELCVNSEKKHALTWSLRGTQTNVMHISCRGTRAKEKRPISM